MRQRIGHLYPLDTPYLGDDTEGLELIPTYHLDLIGDSLYLTYLIGIIGGRTTTDVLSLGAQTRIAGQGKKSHETGSHARCIYHRVKTECID